MAVVTKPGTRLRSVTCSTEVVIVRGPGRIDRCSLWRRTRWSTWATADAETFEVVAPFDAWIAGREAVRERGRVRSRCCAPSRRWLPVDRRRPPSRSRAPSRCPPPTDGGAAVHLGHAPRDGRRRHGRPRRVGSHDERPHLRRAGATGAAGGDRFWPRLPGDNVVLVDVNSPAVPDRRCSAPRSRASRSCRSTTGSPTTGCAPSSSARRRRRSSWAQGVAERLGGVDGIELHRPRRVPARVADDGVDETDGTGVATRTPSRCCCSRAARPASPKAAVLRHMNLASYLVLDRRVRLGPARTRRRIVSVPPYHIAGSRPCCRPRTAAAASVHLRGVRSRRSGCDAVRAEGVTHAMVVPTMLGRILDDRRGRRRTACRRCGRCPTAAARCRVPVDRAGHADAARRRLRQRLRAHRDVEHDRRARPRRPPRPRSPATIPPCAPGSARSGRPLPGVELSIRDPDGEPAAGRRAGRDLGARRAGVRRVPRAGRARRRRLVRHPRRRATSTTRATCSSRGRLDDVIVRGGENLSPGEIEDVLLEHPGRGRGRRRRHPGRRVGRASRRRGRARARRRRSTEDELRDHVRAQLRSTRTPERIAIRTELPFNETGKLLRRVLREQLSDTFA